MTQRDRWKVRPATTKFYVFRDFVKAHMPEGYTIPDHAVIVFHVEMAPSWSKKKKLDHVGQLHRNKPDIDNMLKALLDSVYEDDAGVAALTVVKKWCYQGEGRIEIYDRTRV